MICKGPCTSDFATVKLIARESQVRFKPNFPAIFNFTATKIEFMVTKVQYNSESCEGTIKKINYPYSKRDGSQMSGLVRLYF